MPNLVNALSDFVSSVDRLVQTETKPDGLLKQMLPILVKLLPGTQALRLYRLSGAEVSPLAATDFDVKPQPTPVVDEDNFLHDAPKSDKPLFDAEKSRWILTLRHGKQVLFLLEIIIKGDNVSSDGEDLLLVVANHLSSIFYTQSLHELLECQMLTFNGLVSGQNIAEAAYVVARNMLKRDSSHLMINKLVYGDDGQVSGWVSLVSADYKQRHVFDENEEPDLLWQDINSTVRQDLLDYEPFILHDLDVADPDELGPIFYRWLEGKQVRSCLCFLIEQNGYPAGVFIVLDQDKNIFGENEVNVFSSIVGYIGALTDVSKMSKEISLSQRIVDNLVLANRLITTAANSVYMAQAVMYTLGEGMVAAAVAMFDRPLTSEQEPSSHICEAVSIDDDVIEFRSIGSLALPSVEGIARLHAGLPIVLEGSVVQEYLPDEMKSVLGEKKIDWLSSFGLRSGNQLLGTLMLMNSSFDGLGEAESSAFTTLADQIGVILHSRQLLEDSRQAHAAAAQLVETNRAISITSDNGEMTWVIFGSMKKFVTLVSMFSFDVAATEKTIPSSVQLDALAIQETSQRPAIVDKLDKNNPAVESFIKELLSGKAIVIDSTHQLQEIMGVSVAHLNKLGAQSFIATGLLVGSRLLGFLLYGIPDNARVSIAQMDSFVSVADQAAITMENRRLFQVTGQSLQEATTLYNANRDLLSSQDGMEVLNALRNYLAPNARELTLYSVGWDEIEDGINSIFVYCFVSDVEGLHSKRQLLDMFEGESAEQLKREWESRKAEVYFYEDLDATEESNLTLATAYVEGARSMAILPVIEDGRLINQVNIVFDAPRSFDENTRRFYSAIRSQLAVVLQNHRLLLDTRTAAANLGGQVRILRTMNHLAATLSTTQDEQILMNSTCEALFNALSGVDHVSIAMLNADQQTSVVASEYPDKGTVGAKTIEDSPIYMRLHGQDTPIVVNDVEADTELDDDARAMAAKLGIKAMLLLPLFDVRVNFIGAIRLDAYKKQIFTEGIVDIARTITSQISTSLQSIRLLHDTQYRARQMEQIAGFSQSIQATLDIETLLEVGITNVMEIIASHHMAIIFHDAARGSLSCVAWQEEDGTPHVDLDSKIHVNLEGTTAGLIRNRPAAFRSDDLAAKEDLRYTFQDDIRSVLSLPVFTRGVLRAIVEIGNRLPGAYGITDYAVFQQIISQLAVGIENAEAYAQSQRLAQRKALVNEISSHLQQKVDIEQILEVTMNELGNALGARRARIRLATEISDEANGSKG